MAVGDSKSDLVTGFLLGLGTAALAPGLAPALAGTLRPLAKSAIKAGLVALDKGRVGSAELGELLEDLIAEARAELETEAAAAPAGANGADPSDASA